MLMSYPLTSCQGSKPRPAGKDRLAGMPEFARLFSEVADRLFDSAWRVGTGDVAPPYG